MLAAGTWVTPNIRLERPLGAGGMGSIWIAEHTTLRTRVVVKLMRPELARDPDTLTRFSREAAAAANVKSPHVVQVFDHGVAPGGAPFIVMELLEGEDLAARMARGPIPPDETATIVSQICKALARAHERGIVHRDIKPQNIFLCNVGGGETFVKVLDFGIAKASGDLQVGLSATSTGSVMGTPYYMSPEQALGHKTLDFRTDLWALGVVVFEMLTAHKPFVGETVGALAVAICTLPLPSPTAIHPALPPSVDAWFARACARDPAQRFASAKELADAFSAAMSGPASLGLARTVPSVPPAVIPQLPALSSTTTAPTSHRPWGAPSAPRGVSLLAWLVAIAIAGASLSVAGILLWRAHLAVSPRPNGAPSAGAPLSTPSPPPIEPVSAAAPLASLHPPPAATTTHGSPTPVSPAVSTSPPATTRQVKPASSFDRNSID